MNQTGSNRQDNRLFTPGPLTTSSTVKAAMQRDLGSRDFEFIDRVADIRRRLLALGEVDEVDYTAILMQGSGIFGLEAVIGSVIPPAGKLLAIVNGAYGRRIAQIADVLKIKTVVLSFPENGKPDLSEIKATLTADTTISHIAVVHCETTTGIINPIAAVGVLAERFNCTYIVDAMSSFGAIPLNLEECAIDYLISSANKCIEGVPGFAFVLARKSALLATEGYARSLSLDLLAQYQGLEANGQFRFTPPTHALLAFHQALVELEAEGGIAARAWRYQRNYETLVAGMLALGLKTYLQPEDQGYIITSFHYPDHANFQFEDFYERLHAKGFTIYPGKVSDAFCFRIGHIGHLFEKDMQLLLEAVQDTLREMEITLNLASGVG